MLCCAAPRCAVLLECCCQCLGSKESNCLGDTFCLAEALGGLKVVGVAAGLAHTVACMDSGDVYSWGWNADGQLGLGGDTGRGEPELVSDAKLEHEHVDQVKFMTSIPAVALLLTAACCKLTAIQDPCFPLKGLLIDLVLRLGHVLRTDQCKSAATHGHLRLRPA